MSDRKLRLVLARGRPKHRLGDGLALGQYRYDHRLTRFQRSAELLGSSAEFGAMRLVDGLAGRQRPCQLR
jgi:hypothetical protein